MCTSICMVHTGLAATTYLCTGSCSRLLNGGLGGGALCGLLMRRLQRLSLINIVHLQQPFPSQF